MPSFSSSVLLQYGTVYSVHPICYGDCGAGDKKPLYAHHFHHDSPALLHFPMKCIHVFNVDPTSTAGILYSPCCCTSVTLFLAPFLSLTFLPKILVYLRWHPFIPRTSCPVKCFSSGKCTGQCCIDGIEPALPSSSTQCSVLP